MKDWIQKLTPLLLIVSLSSCSPYRVVPLARGVDQDGNIHQFYAVAHNNVIIPEYVVDERGVYPTDEETAWNRFQERKESLEVDMNNKYQIPGDGASQTKRSLLGLGFLAVSPISYPIYALSSEEGERGVSDYFDLMVQGPTGKEPKLRDAFENF